MSYTITSVKGSKVEQVDLPAAVALAVLHEQTLLPAGGTTVEDSDGETVATIRGSADEVTIVVEMADGTEIDVTDACGGLAETRALIRSALGR